MSDLQGVASGYLLLFLQKIQQALVHFSEGDGIYDFQEFFESLMVKPEDIVQPLWVFTYEKRNLIHWEEKDFRIFLHLGTYLTCFVVQAAQEGHNAAFARFNIIQKNFAAILFGAHHLQSSAYNNRNGADK